MVPIEKLGKVLGEGSCELGIAVGNMCNEVDQVMELDRATSSIRAGVFDSGA